MSPLLLLYISFAEINRIVLSKDSKRLNKVLSVTIFSECTLKNLILSTHNTCIPF